MRFEGKVAVVTGSGGGIGLGIAKRFASEKAKIIVAEKNVTLGKEAIAEICKMGSDGIFVETDVSSKWSVEHLVETVNEQYGRIDILVNNAAVLLDGSFLETSFEKWQTTIDINLTGVFLTSQSVAKYMISHSINGRIVNLASINSFAAEKDTCSYVASKGGVNLLTKAMAVDLAPYNITVNAVAPGPILVERNRTVFEADPLRSGIEKGVLLGKPGTPEDIAAAVTFLSSDDAKFINGTTLVVDGGYLSYARFD